jgi:CubicO group peptidase (beta-lactamase class C family)
MDMLSRRRTFAAGLGTLAIIAARSRFALASPPVAGGLVRNDDDWVTASPGSQGIPGTNLDNLFDDASSIQKLRSIVVIRNGFLIGERYYGGTSMSDLRAIHSVTKSVGSMLVGRAIELGAIKSVTQTLGDLFPEAARKSPASPVNGVSLAEILTMTSGLDNDMVSYWQNRSIQRGNPPMWDYNDAAVGLLSIVFAEAVGMPIEQFANRELFGPLGIKDFAWPRDADGYVQTHTGLQLRPRDLAKIAWIMADKGRWRGRQVLSANWVEESTRSHVVPRWRLTPVTDIGYGYLWFNGKLKGTDVAWGWGYGAQFAMAIPSLHLAVATAADPPNFADDLREQNRAVIRLVAQVVDLVT